MARKPKASKEVDEKELPTEDIQTELVNETLEVIDNAAPAAIITEVDQTVPDEQVSESPDVEVIEVDTSTEIEVLTETNSITEFKELLETRKPIAELKAVKEGGLTFYDKV